MFDFELGNGLCIRVSFSGKGGDGSLLAPKAF